MRARSSARMDQGTSLETDTQAADPIEESRRIVRVAHEKHVTLRLIGGLAIRFHCHGEHAAHLREYHDIDLFGLRKKSEAIFSVFQDLDYSPNDRFNSLYHETRLQFIHKISGKNVDLFLDKFVMEHILDFRERLRLDELTIPITDLLLTKLQIERQTEKDVKDTIAILEDHQMGHDDDRETINLDYIADLCSRDWGLYKTITDNLEWMNSYVRKHAPSPKGREELVQKLAAIQKNVGASKKRLRWKVRNVFGERIKWYEQVETGEGEV
mgnify:CR=1 FL=1